MTELFNNICELIYIYDRARLLPSEWAGAYIKDNDLKLFNYQYIGPWECYIYEYNWESKFKDKFEILYDLNVLKDLELVSKIVSNQDYYFVWKIHNTLNKIK